MKDEELQNLASQFINQWQENFAKSMSDPQIISVMMQSVSNMQQFYEKFTPATASRSYESGSNEPNIRDLYRKIDELEERIRELEASRPRARKTSKK